MESGSNDVTDQIINEEAIKEARISITLQELLTNITKDEIEQTKMKILKSPFAQEIDRVPALVNNIFCVVPIRPKKMALLAEIVHFLLSRASDDNALSSFKSLFLRQVTRNSEENKYWAEKIPLFTFLRHCYVKKAFLFSDISQHISKWLREKNMSINQLVILYFIFLPELVTYDPTLLEGIKKIIVAKKSGGFIHDSLLPLFSLTNKLHENGWRLHTEMMKYGCLRDSLEFALKYDDVDLLKKIMHEDKQFDVNDTLTVFPLESSIVLRKSPTLIQYSAFFGSVNCFKHLFENGANIHKNNYRDRTIADFAINGLNNEIMNLVFNSGVDFSTTLKAATEFRNYDAFDIIFSRSDRTTQEFRNNLNDALKECAKSNNFRTLIYCVQNGCDIRTTYKDGLNLTHYSAMRGHCGLVSYLIHYDKSAVMSRAAFGMTPLHFAAKTGYNDVVRLLLSRKDVDVNAVTHSGWTPLHLSAMKGHNGISHALVNHRDYIVDVKDGHENTPLHYASMNGYADITSLLIEKGSANINEPNSDGNTPIHLAAMRGQIDVVEYLLNKVTCNPNVTNKRGQTAYQIAADNVKVVFEDKYSSLKAQKASMFSKCSV